MFALGAALRFGKLDDFYIYSIGIFSRYYFLETDKFKAVIGFQIHLEK